MMHDQAHPQFFVPMWADYDTYEEVYTTEPQKLTKRTKICIRLPQAAKEAASRWQERHSGEPINWHFRDQIGYAIRNRTGSHLSPPLEAEWEYYNVALANYFSTFQVNG